MTRAQIAQNQYYMNSRFFIQILDLPEQECDIIRFMKIESTLGYQRLDNFPLPATNGFTKDLITGRVKEKK